MPDSDSQLTLIESGDLSELEDVASRALKYAKSGKAESTKDAYRSDFRHFDEWCERHGLDSLPASPATVGLYITSMADGGYATSTIGRRLVAISQAHKLSDLEPPTTSEKVREIWKGIRRQLGTAQKGKRPLLTVEIRQIIQQLDVDMTIDVRDRALILLGFAGAFRRSELVAIDVDDMDFRNKGVVVELARSKTDQEGQGRTVAIPHGRHDETCPVGAVQEWLELVEDESGPLFRSVTRGGSLKENRISGRTVCRVVKKRVQSIGLDPDAFGAHSLRAGFATAAAQAGASERDIMRQTGHSSLETVRGYIREGSLFQSNAAQKIGL